MTERIRFHFDPLCPWAWQGSRWIREVERVRDVEVTWRLFSLGLINADSGNPSGDAHAHGMSVLRCLALLMREEGNEAVGRAYEAIGDVSHERGEQVSDDVVRDGLRARGFDPHLFERAAADESTLEIVRREHAAAVDEVGCFGVPTVVLPSGRGIFGPVVSLAPRGEVAGQLWDHVRWLADAGEFFELKRSRDRRPGQAA